MAATATTDKAIKRILKGIKNRQVNDRWGIGTAGMYLRKLLTPGFVQPKGWDEMVKAADTKLVYCDPKMLIEKSVDGNKIALTEGSIFDFNCVLTTKSMDRDGDVMEPMGCELDPFCPLLWQHMPDQPIGKLVKELSKTDEALRVQFGIADTALGTDAATLIEFGALRMSHGFIPLKFAPRHSKDASGVDWEGWRITKFMCIEGSVVSVPSNQEAVITAFSRQKLCTPMIKSWAKGLFDARPVQVPGAALKSADDGDDGDDDDDDDGMKWCAGCNKWGKPDSHGQCSSCGDDDLYTDPADAFPSSGRGARQDQAIRDAQNSRPGKAIDPLTGQPEKATPFKSSGNPLIDTLFGVKTPAASNPAVTDDGGQDDQVCWCQKCGEMVTPNDDDDCPKCGSDLCNAPNTQPDSMTGEKAKKPKKPAAAKPDDGDGDDDDMDPEQYGESDDGVGISEKAVAKCAMGVKGCEHFGQAFVNHAMKSVHHTMCQKCFMPQTKGKAGNAGDDPDEPTDEWYHNAEQVQDMYAAVPGVQHVTVAMGYHPPLNKGWQQVHPISREWSESVKTGGPGQLQNQQQQANGGDQNQQNTQAGDSDKGFDPMAVSGDNHWQQPGSKNVATYGKKWMDCCGGGSQLAGSWDETMSMLRGSLYDYLRENGVDDLPAPPDPADTEPVSLPWVSISAMFDDHAIVCVYYPNRPMSMDDTQPCYSLDWSMGDDGKPMWSGDPTPVKITTSVTVTAADMSKAVRFMRTKAKDDKPKCDHMNKDGTFAGGFDGCVSHMTSECGGGHSEDSAKKICGTIAQNVGKCHRATVRSPEEFASFKTLWARDGIEAIGGKLKSALKDPAEVQHIFFDSEQWSPEEAKAWLKANDYPTKDWSDAAREAANAARHVGSAVRAGAHRVMEGLGNAIARHAASEQADELSEEAHVRGKFADDATEHARNTGDKHDMKDAEKLHNQSADLNRAAAAAQRDAGREEYAKEHEAEEARHRGVATGHHNERLGLGGAGREGTGGKPESDASQKPVDPAKLAQQQQQEAGKKSGRVLSGSNAQHVQEAMDCHQEILKMGPEHASKACKALVKEAHGHLNDVISSVGPSATEPTVKQTTIGDVRAFLASASHEDVEEAQTMIQSRKRRNGRGRPDQLLAKLLGR